MSDMLLLCLVLGALSTRSHTQTPAPAAEITCCEGDILLLLDSSGSLTDYEFSRLLHFTAELLRPFPLGRGRIRVGLVQVGTSPHLVFSLDVYNSQESLQDALQRVRHLRGNTNTVEALRLAAQLLAESEEDAPKLLLWLTDGTQPGDVDQTMTELKAKGVSVVTITTLHANYQVLQRAVTPPVESHLFTVDMDDIDIITEDLRKAIIKIFHANRLHVARLTSHSAVLRWSPLLTAESGYYEFTYSPMYKMDPEIRRTLQSDSSSVELTDLQPDTMYTASLQPESNQRLHNTLSVSFTTRADVLSPTVVTVSDSGPHHFRVSWGPLQPAHVQRYTVEYGAIPSGGVQTLMFDHQENTTLLTGLEQDTQYLVTVSALHVNGQEVAMSVTACTQEALPALLDLQLTPLEDQEVEVMWKAQQQGLKGYWLNWERQKPHFGSSNSSSLHLSPSSHSTRLTHLRPGSRVCVFPVFGSGRGDGLCCTAESHTDSSQ